MDNLQVIMCAIGSLVCLFIYLAFKDYRQWIGGDMMQF